MRKALHYTLGCLHLVDCAVTDKTQGNQTNTPNQDSLPPGPQASPELSRDPCLLQHPYSNLVPAVFTKVLSSTLPLSWILMLSDSYGVVVSMKPISQQAFGSHKGQ